MAKTVLQHLEKDTLTQEYWVPQHDERRQRTKFKRNKQFLRDEVKLGCWVCGAKQSAENPLEVYHVFEWALWNTIDPARVTAILEVLEFYEDGYKATAEKRDDLEIALKKVEAVKPLPDPDDIRNLVVVCQEHHRSRFTGIHMISFPIWLSLAAVKKDYALVRRRAVIVKAANHLRRLDEAVADVVVRPAGDGEQ